jgi:hypothetical protein
MSGISDEQLLAVIDTGKGSARDILDATVELVLTVKQQQDPKKSVA